MNLTPEYLQEYCTNHRISIPPALAEELIAYFTDGEDYAFTEQDICEQLRKRLK